MAALEIRVVGAVLVGSVAWVVQSGDPWDLVIQVEEQKEQKGLKPSYLHSASPLSLR